MLIFNVSQVSWWAPSHATQSTSCSVCALSPRCLVPPSPTAPSAGQACSNTCDRCSSPTPRWRKVAEVLSKSNLCTSVYYDEIKACLLSYWMVWKWNLVCNELEIKSWSSSEGSCCLSCVRYWLAGASTWSSIWADQGSHRTQLQHLSGQPAHTERERCLQRRDRSEKWLERMDFID